MISRCLLTLLLLTVVAVSLVAQDITLRGQVVREYPPFIKIENKFVSNVQVAAPMSSTTITDNQGRFQLRFEERMRGEDAELYVSHPKYNLANPDAVKVLTVRPNREVRIYVVRKSDYYKSRKIAERRLLAGQKRKEKELLAALATTNHHQERLWRKLDTIVGSTTPISSNSEAEIRIQAYFDKIGRSLPEVAANVAKINSSKATKIEADIINRISMGLLPITLGSDEINEIGSSTNTSLVQISRLDNQIKDLISARDDYKQTVKSNLNTIRINSATLLALGAYDEAISTTKEFFNRLDFTKLSPQSDLTTSIINEVVYNCRLSLLRGDTLSSIALLKKLDVVNITSIIHKWAIAELKYYIWGVQAIPNIEALTYESAAYTNNVQSSAVDEGPLAIFGLGNADGMFLGFIIMLAELPVDSFDNDFAVELLSLRLQLHRADVYVLDPILSESERAELRDLNQYMVDNILPKLSDETTQRFVRTKIKPRQLCSALKSLIRKAHKCEDYLKIPAASPISVSMLLSDSHGPDLALLMEMAVTLNQVICQVYPDIVDSHTCKMISSIANFGLLSRLEGYYVNDNTPIMLSKSQANCFRCLSINEAVADKQ